MPHLNNNIPLIIMYVKEQIYYKIKFIELVFEGIKF